MKQFFKKFNDGEHLIKIIEPDIFQFVPRFLWFVFALLYAGGVGFIFYTLKPDPVLRYIILGFSGILLIWYIRFVTVHLLTYVLITSNRLIYVKRHGLFKKDVIELHYNRFKTVSCHLRGFLFSLLSIGEVVIDRGGLNDTIVLKYVRHPQIVQDLIMKLQREYKYTYVRQEHDSVNSTRPGTNDYISARDLIFFLNKFISAREGNYELSEKVDENENK